MCDSGSPASVRERARGLPCSSTGRRSRPGRSPTLISCTGSSASGHGKMGETLSLGELMDCATVQRELGVSRKAAEAIMRQLPKGEFDGLRKVYVKRADVERLVAERTVTA